MKMSRITKLPVLFLSHGGGPSFFMDSGSLASMGKNSPSADFLRRMFQDKTVFPEATASIKAIVVFSAHWEEPQVTVGCQEQGTSLIYDYYGFPPETYAPHLTYPAPTDLALAEKVYDLLQAANIPCQKADRGFDHGVFIPLKVARPQADIPIVQVSLHASLDPAFHIRLGEALSSLREEGVLIVGSGFITHNLRRASGSKITKETVAFVEWVRAHLEGIETQEQVETSRELLANIASTAPHLLECHPRTEHLIPLHVTFGAAYPHRKSATSEEYAGDESVGACKRIYHEAIGNMVMDCYAFL